MSEVDASSPANLEDERDELRFELIVLQGHLIKDKFDLSRMIDPLLADTAPATIEINARLKRLVDRMKAQLDSLPKPDLNNLKPTTPSPAPPPQRGRILRQLFLLLYVTVLVRKNVLGYKMQPQNVQRQNVLG